MTVTLDDIRQARTRIAGALRHTPVVEAAPPATRCRDASRSSSNACR